jgi:hypothetical protein
MTPSATSLERTEPRRKLTWLGVAISAVISALLLIAAAWWIGGPVIPASTLKGLRGATQADVRRILGDPSRVQADGEWIYARRLNPGWVQICFDGAKCVSGVNDEQACPEFFGSGSWEQ